MKNANAVVATPYRGQDSTIAVLFQKAQSKTGITLQAALSFLKQKKVKHPDQMIRHIAGGRHRGYSWKVTKTEKLLKVSDVKAPVVKAAAPAKKTAVKIAAKSAKK